VNGAPVADGTYQAVLTVVDDLASFAQALPLTVDTRPPTLTLLSAPDLHFSLDEPATVFAVVDGGSVTLDEPPGEFSLPHDAPAASVSAYARDAAGNTSLTVTSGS
jgi:hypothetical protein